MNWFNVLKYEWTKEITQHFAWDKLIEISIYKGEAEIVITHELNPQFIEHFKDKFEIEFMNYNKSTTKPRYKYHIRRKEV